MRTIIVDDERLAREELKSLLKEYANIEIIGEYKKKSNKYSFIFKLGVLILFVFWCIITIAC